MRSWIEFWDGEHAIYVNDRHKQLHAEAVGRDLISHIPSRDAVVLDHGCGEANYAAEVARQCGWLYLCDAAQGVRADLAYRVSRIRNIEVVSPEGVETVPDRTLDLVVANSLVQYLARRELIELLGLWRRKLKPTGILVLADVIPPDISPLRDAASLLWFGLKGGFLLAAVAGLVRTAFSDYRKVRAQLGLTTYSAPDFIMMLADQGFIADRVRPNFGHNQGRMTFRAVRG
jgi:ubiquinone/menaquinone biosynthesis C-methylase UbiE